MKQYLLLSAMSIFLLQATQSIASEEENNYMLVANKQTKHPSEKHIDLRKYTIHSKNSHSEHHGHYSHADGIYASYDKSVKDHHAIIESKKYSHVDGVFTSVPDATHHLRHSSEYSSADGIYVD
jgi:hypothetical protein